MPSIEPNVWAEFQTAFNGPAWEMLLVQWAFGIGMILLTCGLIYWFYKWQGLGRIEYNDIVSVTSGFHRKRVGKVIKMCWFGCVGYYVIRDSTGREFIVPGARIRVNSIGRKVKNR